LPRNFAPKIGKSIAVQWLYPSEEAQLVACEALLIERRLLWGVLAREGMRDGSEATALTWECLDLERRDVSSRPSDGGSEASETQDEGPVPEDESLAAAPVPQPIVGLQSGLQDEPAQDPQPPARTKCLVFRRIR
jgi:hypothetical protein